MKLSLITLVTETPVFDLFIYIIYFDLLIYICIYVYMYICIYVYMYVYIFRYLKYILKQKTSFFYCLIRKKFFFSSQF